MSWTFSDIKTADAVLGIADVAQAAATLNAQTVNVPVDLQWSAIRDILMNNFDWGTLVVVSEQAIGGALPGGGTQTFAIKAAAASIRECCLYGGVFASSNTTIWTRLTTAAGLLTPATVGGISSASANAVVSSRAPTMPKWVPTVDAGDIQTARAQP